MTERSIGSHFRGALLAIGAAWGVALAATSPARAQAPDPVGGEFQVNTVTLGAQYSAAVAADSDGDFRRGVGERPLGRDGQQRLEHPGTSRIR